MKKDYPVPGTQSGSFSKGPAYISKNERRIEISDPTGKWSDVYLLPEWGEEYCDVYTARKHGKWVMLKTLKKEHAGNPDYRARLEKEFDTRYNLCHPNLVMVNDFEEVPGLGRAIITDDVYGYSLRQLIDERRLTPKIVHRLQTQLLDVMEYIQENHIQHEPITPSSIIFTEYNENLKLADVGFDRAGSLTEQDTRKDIESYGKVIGEVLDNLPASLPRLRHIANKCKNGEDGYRTVSDLQLDMERRTSSQLFVLICIFLCIMAAVLVFLTFRNG